MTKENTTKPTSWQLVKRTPEDAEEETKMEFESSLERNPTGDEILSLARIGAAALELDFLKGSDDTTEDQVLEAQNELTRLMYEANLWTLARFQRMEKEDN